MLVSKKIICAVAILVMSLSNYMIASEKKSSLSAKIYNEIKESSKIFGLAVGSVFAYGILNDQITARICLEYFTKGFHESMLLGWTGPILSTVRNMLLAYKGSATIVGIIWGVIATFSIAIIAGIVITFFSRLLKWPKLNVSDLKYPMMNAMGITGIGALAGGIVGYHKAAVHGVARMWANANVASGNLVGWQVCAYAHSAAYLVGPIAIVGLCAWIVYRRYRLKKNVSSIIAVT